jgi:hypothetical protein
MVSARVPDSRRGALSWARRGTGCIASAPARHTRALAAETRGQHRRGVKHLASLRRLREISLDLPNASRNVAVLFPAHVAPTTELMPLAQDPLPPANASAFPLPQVRPGWQAECVISRIKRGLGSAPRGLSDESPEREIHLKVFTHNVMVLVGSCLKDFSRAG